MNECLLIRFHEGIFSLKEYGTFSCYSTRQRTGKYAEMSKALAGVHTDVVKLSALDKCYWKGSELPGMDCGENYKILSKHKAYPLFIAN